jgi:hypothetical protein
MAMVEASCHCGTVRLAVPHLPDQVTACNCSICRRLGTWCAYYDPAEVKFLAGEDHLDTYGWGDRTILFRRCRTCGCAVDWVANPEKPPIARTGVNARLFPPEIVNALRVRRFDGADTWTYLDEA